MNLFINDKHVKVVKMEAFTAQQSKFSRIIDGQTVEVAATDLEGDVAVTNPSVVLLYRLFALLRDKKLKKLSSLTLASPDKQILTEAIKAPYRIIEAAGGVVRKDNRILMIYRLGVWDLPKGKMEKDETFRQTAVREVEEECRVKVQLHEKICTTWHTYTQNGSGILKQTKWYAMTCLDDSEMAPQREEGIERVEWISEEKALELTATSYPSIRFVCRKYFDGKQSGDSETGNALVLALKRILF